MATVHTDNASCPKCHRWGVDLTAADGLVVLVCQCGNRVTLGRVARLPADAPLALALAATG